MKIVKHKGCTVTQLDNNLITIYKDGASVFTKQYVMSKSVDELRGLVEEYLKGEV